MSRGLFASTEYGQRQVGLWEERWKYKEQALGDLPVYREKMNPQDDWLVVTVDYHD